MTGASDHDKVLEKLLLLEWQRAGTPAKDLEVWPIPRPTGGIGLCVNFLPMENDQSEAMVRIVITNLIETGIAKRYSALQFAVSRPLADPNRNIVVSRYFLEDDRLRALESDPESIRNASLDTLVTTKIELPFP